MSFIGATEKGSSFAPGWFLESEVGVVRKTRQMAQAGASASEDGRKYVLMGTVWPANDATAEGIVYEDIDVTDGDAPGRINASSCSRSISNWPCTSDCRNSYI